MFNDSPNRPKIITNTIGVAPGSAPTNRVTRIGDRGSSWASEQLEQPPTFRIGNGQKAQFVSGSASAVARSRVNMDPRIIPPINAQYIADLYGGNELKHTPTQKEVAKLKSIQLNKDRARGNMNEPAIQGGSFGARSQQEIRMQKTRLKTWDADNNQSGWELPSTDVRNYVKG